MEWQKLDLTKASLLKKEVDQVVSKVPDLINNPSIDRGNFLAAIQSRIQELEDFYLAHSDDERAILFEKERLRLRKAIQPLYVSRENRSVSGISSEHHQTMGTTGIGASDRSMTSSSFAKYANSTNNSAVGPTMTQNQSLNNVSRSGPNLQVDNRSIKSGKTSMSNANRSVVSSVSKKTPQPIYSWEEKSEKVLRDEMVIDGISFVPTGTPGFYGRVFEDGEAEEYLSDRFIDFQLILTQEEVTTLAARRKAEKQDVKLVKNLAAATSVHAATPYVEPKRIVQEMLRPGQPDRWIHPDGMKPAMK